MRAAEYQSVYATMKQSLWMYREGHISLRAHFRTLEECGAALRVFWSMA